MVLICAFHISTEMNRRGSSWLTLYRLIKKPEKDVCCLTRTPCTFRRVTRALHIYSRPCNGNVNRLVMDAAERDREVRSMLAPAKVVFLHFFC